MIPENIRRRLGRIQDDTSQIDSWSAFYVHIRSSNNFGWWFCPPKNGYEIAFKLLLDGWLETYVERRKKDKSYF